MLPIQVLLIVALSVICVLLLVLLIRKKKSTCNQDELSENFQNLAELINGIHKKITEVEKIEHIIQSDTNSLSKILSNSNMSGKWGEMYLKKVVETSGMTPYCDFIEQEQSENSPKRPDMVIKLPGNRCVIVDSKAPINTYAKAVNSEDKDMKEYVKSLKGHIKDLSQKSYWKEYDYNTPEFVVMFLPVESLLSDILKEDSELIEHGIRQNVLIATPINFIAILKSIHFSWRQEAMAKNAKEIGEAGRDVVIVLENLMQEFRNFWNELKKSMKNYRKIDELINGEALPIANKLKTLGIEVNEEKTDAIDNA